MPPCHIPRWQIWTAAGVIAAIGVAIYANSFNGAFVFDDKQGILEKASLWREKSLWEVMLDQGQTPVLAATVALNFRWQDAGPAARDDAAGSPRVDPWGFHLVNLTIHVLAALTLMGLVRRTLLTDRLRGRFGRAALPLAWAVAALWMAHPIQTESVTYIIQRKESLMGLLYLLALYCTARAAGARFGRGWLAGAVLACALGMGVKQVMVTAPVMVLLYDRTFLAGTFRKALARRWAFYLALAATWSMLLSSAGRLQQEGLGAAEKGLGTFDYLRTQAGVLLHYLGIAFWPTGLCIDYGWPVAQGLAEYLPQGLAILALLGATAWLLWRRPAAGFVGAWFFVILAPTSSLLVITELAFEHRMYLSLAGVAAAVVFGTFLAGRWALARMSPRGAGVAGWALASAATLPVVGVLGWLTFDRNRVYASALALWEDAAAKRPDNPRARLNYGDCLADAGMDQLALREFDKAVELRPTYQMAYLNRGIIYRKLRQYDKSISDLHKLIELAPGGWPQRFQRGMACVQAARGEQDLPSRARLLGEAVVDFTAAIERNPASAESYVERGNALAELALHDPKHFEAAIRDYDRAIELKRDCFDAYRNRGNMYASLRQFERAVSSYSQAIQLRPDDPECRYRRGMAYSDGKQYPLAVQDFTEVIRLRPGLDKAYQYRAFCYMQLQQYDRAWQDVRACRTCGGQPDPALLKDLQARSGRSE